MNAKRWIVLAVGCVLIFASVLVVGFRSRPYLTIRVENKKKTVVEKPAEPGDNVWVVFINSVEGLPVADHFEVGKRLELVFKETIYRAPYAGYDKGEKQELVAPGTMRISGYNRRMNEISFFAGHLSRHMLFLNGHWVSLYDEAEGGDIVRIAVIERTGFASMKKRIRSDDK